MESISHRPSWVSAAIALQRDRSLALRNGTSLFTAVMPRIRAAWTAMAKVIIHQPIVRVEMLGEPFSKSWVMITSL